MKQVKIDSKGRMIDQNVEDKGHFIIEIQTCWAWFGLVIKKGEWKNGQLTFSNNFNNYNLITYLLTLNFLNVINFVC
jgi:hypothetical protein